VLVTEEIPGDSLVLSSHLRLTDTARRTLSRTLEVFYHLAGAELQKTPELPEIQSNFPWVQIPPRQKKPDPCGPWRLSNKFGVIQIQLWKRELFVSRKVPGWKLNSYTGEPCKNSWTGRSAIWGWATCMGPRNHV